MKFLTALLSVLMLTACGGGGSSSVSPGTTQSFSLGGSITGLGDARWFTLVNGSETLAIAPNATTFVFANKLPQNTAYNVTVGTQPAGTVCTVSGGSATMGKADITSLTVGCAPRANVGSLKVSTLAGDDGQTLIDGTGGAVRFGAPHGIAMDSAGNIYVADTSSHSIRKVSPLGAVTTLAGNGLAGFVDGTGAAARFNNPAGVAVDNAGNVYVADSYNSAIRKISPSGVVTTLAGNGQSGLVDGVGSAARFDWPHGIALDGAGDLVVSDFGNNTIRKVSLSGAVTTLAGNAQGFADGLGGAASFNRPAGVAVDINGNVYVADSSNAAIRKISPTGLVSTLAGGTFGDADGVGSAAQFGGPQGITLDNAGNLYVSDNNSIRKVSPAGVVTTWVGSGTGITFGLADGTGTAARFNGPTGLVIDGVGNLNVADEGNRAIRQVSPAGVVTTLVGQGPVVGLINGTGVAARFASPVGVAMDSAGNLYVADSSNLAIRKIAPSGLVTTLAGGTYGNVDGVGPAASFLGTAGVAADGEGNVYVADGVRSIRKITGAGLVTTLAGDPDTDGFADGVGTSARFTNPSGVAVDKNGYVYVADTANNAIRKISPSGVVTTLAGDKSGGFVDGTGSAARFQSPRGVAVDGAGNVYVADDFNSAIRKISPAGVVTTLAGGSYGFVDGTGAAARFRRPTGVAVDSAGNVYVAGDELPTIRLDPLGGGAIRKISGAGVVTTLAGDGTGGFIDGTGAAARFNHPRGVAVDSAGNLYVADRLNNAIRKIVP